MAGFGIQKRGTSPLIGKRKKFEDGGLSVEENKKPLTTYERQQQRIKEREEKIKQVREKRGYDAGKAKYSREKDIESPKIQNILKKYRENISDPTSKFLGIGNEFDEASDKARKEILGYKKGGLMTIAKDLKKSSAKHLKQSKMLNKMITKKGKK